MPSLNELFKHFKGQPVEVITPRFKAVGLVCESDECGVTLIDRMSRLVRIENKLIEAVIEPQMCLRRVFGDDLGCEMDECDIDFCCDRKCKCKHKCHCEHEHEDRRDHECEEAII